MPLALAGGRCRTLCRLPRWPPERHAPCGPGDVRARTGRTLSVPASVHGTDPLSLPLRSPGWAARALSLLTPPNCPHSRHPRLGQHLEPPWVGLSCGAHRVKGCVGGLGSSRAFRSGSRRIATAVGGFPGLECWGTQGPPVSEEGLHSTSLGVWVPLAVLDQNLQVAQKRSLLRGWIPDPLPARPRHWREESQKLSPSLFFFFCFVFLGKSLSPSLSPTFFSGPLKVIFVLKRLCLKRL